MGKKLIGIALIAIMLFGVFGLTACEPPNGNEDKGLRAGFESNGERAPSIWCGFTSEKSRLKVGEDLIIMFYYAPQSDFNCIYVYDPAPISVTAEVFMGHGVYTRKLLQKGEYTHSQPEYIFDYESIEQFAFKEIDNFSDSDHYPVAGSLSTATETIVISADWFVGKMGGIVWSVMAQLTWAETEIEPKIQGGDVSLYYKIEGENIILYDSYYNFFNDIRK